MFQEKINRIVEDGYDLNISNILGQAYNLVIKKVLLLSILFSVFYFFITMLVQYISYVIAGVNISEFIETYTELVALGDIERLESYAKLNSRSS